ncbi:hypothetical protein YC2023_051626 [Brassica napus]
MEEGGNGAGVAGNDAGVFSGTSRSSPEEEPSLLRLVGYKEREYVKEKRPELEELCRKDTVRRDNEERSKNHSSSNDHPLLCDNPHGIVPFLEIDVFQESSSPNLDKFSAIPRLFSTHMPLHAMQEYSSEFVTTGRYGRVLKVSRLSIECQV